MRKNTSRFLTSTISLVAFLTLCAVAQNRPTPAEASSGNAADPGLPLWLSGRAQADGAFQLHVAAGGSTGPLIIEVSPDMIHWSPVFTNGTADNPVVFTDRMMTAVPMRFYRAYRATPATAEATRIFSPVVATLSAPASATGLPRIVDLTPFYEKGFDGMAVWTSLDGLPFHLGGRIELFGTELARWGQTKPKAARGIGINAAFEELHLIHDAVWSEVPDRAVAIVRLHYRDGETRDFPIQYNVQVLDWNRMPSEEKEILTDAGTKIIWRGPGVIHFKGEGRLFKSVLNNPRPTVPVSTMDVISTETRVTYRLVAATIAQRDPQRAVTPGLTLNQPSARFDGSLTVKVVDATTGMPVAKADVYPFTQVEGVGIVIAPQLTSKEGEMVIRYSVSGTEYIGLRVSKPGYRDRQQMWRRGSLPGEVICRVTPNE
jgi:hypothetical protein